MPNRTRGDLSSQIEVQRNREIWIGAGRGTTNRTTTDNGQRAKRNIQQVPVLLVLEYNSTVSLQEDCRAKKESVTNTDGRSEYNIPDLRLSVPLFSCWPWQSLTCKQTCGHSLCANFQNITPIHSHTHSQFIIVYHAIHNNVRTLANSH